MSFGGGLLLGGGGFFKAGQTASGCTFHEPRELEGYIRRLTGNPIQYRLGQMDIWFTKRLSLIHWAESRIQGQLGRPLSVTPFHASKREKNCVVRWVPPTGRG